MATERRLVAAALAEARRVPLAVAFIVLLAVCEIVWMLLPKQDAARLAAWASTNVAHLRSEPFGPLVASAFVVEDHPLAWLVLGARRSRWPSGAWGGGGR